MSLFGTPCSYMAYLDLEETKDFDDYYQYVEEGEDFVDYFQSFENNLNYFQYLGEEEEEEEAEKEDFHCELFEGSNFEEEEEEEEYVKDFNYQYFEDFGDFEDFGYFEEEEEVINEIWMNDYCNLHKILLVGEGDFSFSASLALAFGSATNIVATSLDSTGYLRENYGRAMSNIQELTNRGCNVVHGVDATEMANHWLLKGMKFDRIVFNFPHAGCSSNIYRETQLWLHRELVGEFLVNAKKMINPEGEIHVRNKSNGFFGEWNLERLGSNLGLRLLEEVHFNFTDYPGYRTKYGFWSDKNFNCNPSKTYKFGLP